MGQTTSTSLDKAALLSSYDQIPTKSQLGTIISHKITKQTYLLKQLNFPDSQDYKKSLKANQLKKDKLKQNVLNLIQLQNQSKSLFCSEIYRLSLIYEFSQITLTKEIEARETEGRYFEEQDMWSILQSCLYGLMELNEKMILQTNRVFIMTDGLVKIIDADLITNNSWYMLDENLYYSPERFENFDSSYKVNITEQDVMFSLGATLLNTAILEDIFDCYEYGSHRFNERKLREKLDKLEKLYSEEFCNVVGGLLEIDSEKRMSIDELQEIVGKMMSQDTEDHIDAISARKQEASYQQQDEYKESGRESVQESVRQSVPNVYLAKQQRKNEPFREINNYHQQPTVVSTGKWDKPSYKQTESFHIPAPPTIKFKNIEIKTTLQPIIQQNPTREYTKFQPPVPHFSNYKEVEESQFQSIYPPRGQNSQIYSVKSKGLSSSPLGYDGKLESVRSKNVSQFNHSYYDVEEYVQPPMMYKVNPAQNDENLFTNPQLMEQIRRDMSEITARRSLMPTPSKSNHSAYSTHQEPSSSYYPHPPVRSQLPPPLLQKPKPKPSVHYEQDGKVFQGTLINGLKQGHGKLSYPQGPYYLGNFWNDKMHGEGILYYDQNKPAYDGQWYQDQFHGKGFLFNENPLYQNQPFDYHDFNLVEDYWTKYEGEFVADNKEGLGRLYLSNGEMFEGYFEADCINGEGVFHDKYGEKYEGRWENNVLAQRFSSR